MKLNSKFLAVIIFIILFGGIAFTTAMNWWQTESDKVPTKFSQGEAVGEYNPADIRGSFTFADIVKNFEVPAAELASAFAIETDDPGSVALKDLESVYAGAAAEGYEISTASVRLFVALYTGLPYEIVEQTYLPQPAVDLLVARGNLTDEQLTYITEHSVDLAAIKDSTGQAPAATAPASESVEGSQSERIIKGKTTFQEVLVWGVPKETIDAIFRMEMPNPLTKIKDFCAEKGLDFETIKPALQAEVDKISP